MKREQYLSLAAKLEGEILSSVEYFEIDYEGYESSISEYEEYDVLDYGVNFRMTSGNVFGFKWGSEFTQYGVSILESELQSEICEYRKIEASSSLHWSSLINRKIETVEVIWHWVKKAGIFNKKTYYPQSILLKFSGNVFIVISAMEIGHSSCWGMADNIVVFFNKQAAEQYRALNI